MGFRLLRASALAVLVVVPGDWRSESESQRQQASNVILPSLAHPSAPVCSKKSEAVFEIPNLQKKQPRPGSEPPGEL